MAEKIKYYSSKNIREKNALYNIIFGERSNGKTFDILKIAFEDFINSGEENQLGIIRRWDEDFTGANSARTCYDSLICDGHGKNQIKIISNGKYDGVEYSAGKYYLTTYDNEKQKSIRTDKIIALGFSLTGAEHEHYKSGAFPKIKTILFDEFMTRKFYLQDEFVTFQNLISTIVRQRANVKIYMCGNTVNRYCPYFREMGLYRAKNMSKGDIDVYTYGDSGLTVAVEYSDSPSKSKASDIYFAFNNPRLEMIKSGAWEIDIYPHCPCKYRPCEILFTYFIIFDGDILQCEIIQHDAYLFTFIHAKTTELKNVEGDLIYTTDYNVRGNYKRNILKPTSKLEKRVTDFFLRDKVFYQDNEIGEIVRNYINWCKHSNK